MGLSLEGVTGRLSTSELSFGCSDASCRHSLQVESRGFVFQPIKMDALEAVVHGRLSLPPGDRTV